MMREYPPYARTIAAHIVRGQKPVCVAVMLSSRWGYFDHVPKICIKPEDWEPRRYEFKYLAGLHAVAVAGDECGDLQLAELIVELMIAGPRLLWVYQVDGSKLYDGAFADDLGDWARKLGGEAVNAGNRVAFGEAQMRRAQGRAADLWQKDSDRIQANADIETWTRWVAQAGMIEDRVRGMFANPWQAPGDARAA